MATQDDIKNFRNVIFHDGLKEFIINFRSIHGQDELHQLLDLSGCMWRLMDSIKTDEALKGIFDFLIPLGLDINCERNEVNPGHTALYYCAKYVRKDLAEWLAEKHHATTEQLLFYATITEHKQIKNDPVALHQIQVWANGFLKKHESRFPYIPPSPTKAATTELGEQKTRPSSPAEEIAIRPRSFSELAAGVEKGQAAILAR